MASTNVNVSAASIGRNIELTLTVTGLRVFRARWWVAAQLIRMAACVAGCDIRVERAE